MDWCSRLKPDTSGTMCRGRPWKRSCAVMLAEGAAQRRAAESAHAELAAQQAERAAARLEQAETALATATKELILCAPTSQQDIPAQ